MEFLTEKEDNYNGEPVALSDEEIQNLIYLHMKVKFG